MMLHNLPFNLKKIESKHTYDSLKSVYKMTIYEKVFRLLIINNN